MITQGKCQVESYTRQKDDGWRYYFLTQKTDILALPSIEHEISLSDIYRNVNFKP